MVKNEKIDESRMEDENVHESRMDDETVHESCTEDEKVHESCIANEKKHESCCMYEECLKYDICPMILVQKLLSGKRKIMILWFLSNKVLRFNDIKRKLPDVTQKMLTQQLRSLEEDQLIYRHVYPIVPPKVEYGLTEMGQKIIPILKMMREFGISYLEFMDKDEDLPKIKKRYKK